MKKKKFDDTCMISIKVGDMIQEKGKGRRGILFAIRLVPNGTTWTDPTLIALLGVKFPDSVMIASANHFEPVLNYEYDEEYPSDLFKGAPP